MRTSLLVTAFVVFSCGWSSSASAQCPPDALGCFDDEVMFMWSDTLFDTIDLDSGWVPSGAPLQIRVGFHLAGETQIDMMGTAYAFWPEALSILPLGMAGGGRISVDYGMMITARIRFDVTVLGVRYTWEGDIPLPGGIPRDLLLADEAFFDPFVLPGAMPRPVPLTDTTETIEVASLSLGSIISIPGVDGGLTLGVRGQLDAGYQGERIDVIRREVAGDPAVAITRHAGSAIIAAPGPTGYGAFEDIAVDPVGNVNYRGSLVAVPTLFIEVVGRRFDLALASIDIPILDIDSSPDFAPAEVHVPLPDVATDVDSVDFGVVRVGERAERSVRFRNDGEAELVIIPRAGMAPFVVPTAIVRLAPSAEQTLMLGFAPTRDGVESSLLAFETNDPDRPILTLRARGEGDAPVVADAGPRDAGGRDAGTTPGIAGGACGCSAAGAGDAGPAALVLPLLLLAGAATRRRRTHVV